jgi:hypothetical protein
MGHVSLEHEESDKPIPAEGRKEGDKRNETSRITKNGTWNPFSSANYLQLSKNRTTNSFLKSYFSGRTY